MQNLLKDYVIANEFLDAAGLPKSYIKKNRENIESVSYGNSIYIKKDSLPTIIDRYIAHQCTNLVGYYPIAKFAFENNLKRSQIKHLRESELAFTHYGAYLFKIPDELFSNGKNIMIQLLAQGETEEGYETVIRLNSKLKLASYF